MGTRFTDEQIMTTLRDIVAENPDYVYETPTKPPAHLGDGYQLSECLYVHDDGPGCLVARVLHRLGMPLDELKQHEFNSAGVFGDNDTVSRRTADALEHAQDTQDQGDPWTEALLTAEAAYERES